MQAPFVEFVEDDQPVLLERGIAADHPREDALGDDLDAGARRDPGIEPGAIAHRRAGFLPDRSRHVLRRRSRRDPARLQHDDFPPAEPTGVEQEERHAGGLAGTWWGLQHHTWGPGQLGTQFVPDVVDR